MKKNEKKQVRPLQKQNRPGSQQGLTPISETYPTASGEKKLADKTAVITGGDSGIGKAVALLFAKHGADICIGYLKATGDANQTKKEIENLGRACLLVKGDLGKEQHCKKLVGECIKKFGKIDILINNAALHWEVKSIEDISTAQLMKTFNSNFFSCFWITKYAMRYLKKGSCIINTSSVTAYRGSPKLLDYSSTKGAIISFTRSLANNLIKKGIRVNAVAPGPVWTPLIASSFSKAKIAEFGSDSPMERAAMPNEIAPAYLFLACEDASFISGQVIHPNGGEVVNG
ncbi:MAG: SDR family oxidoreductase [Chitinophagaceae bacterium]|nr:SDR family oxidoreductase [Chitinophagaceae bacterium]